MTVAKGHSTFQMSLSKTERERVDAMAETRGLPTSTFVRMIVAGAIARGGGQLDQLLAAGEPVVEANGGVHNRHGRNYETEWAKVGNQQYTHKSGEWSLVKTARRGMGRGPGSEDPNNWWHLAHASDPTIMKPLAFTWPEAVKLAVRYIERQADLADEKTEVVAESATLEP